MRLHDLAFYASSAFLVGLFLASIVTPLGWIIILGLGTAIFFWRYFSARIALLIVIFFMCGYSYSHLFGILHYDQLLLNEPHTFSAIVSEEPLAKAKSQQLTTHLISPYRGEVQIYTEPYPEYSYGDLISIDGTIQKSFSGALNMVSFPKITLVKHGQGSRIKQWLFTIKRGFIAPFSRVLPAEESALLTGLLTGGTADFSPEFKTAVQQSGMSHIVALSGYNISVVGMALSFLLAFFLTPQKAFYFTVSAIILFVIMTGATASAVRAAIMGIILLIAKRSGRLYNARNSIVITAAIMTLFNPRILAYDIGFQLSFGALLGIIYVMPILEKIMHIETPGFLSWKSNALTTLSAQILVLPLLLYYFQQFNLFSILANVLILEVIPFTMFFGFVLGIAGFFSQAFSFLFALPTSILLKYQILVIHLFARAPIFSLNLAGWMIFIYYGLLIWFLTALSYKRKITPPKNI